MVLLHNHLTLFESHLGSYIRATEAKTPSTLYLPAAYILSLGGKRVRPLATILGCTTMGGTAETALNAALAVELFHNFSLIHDDILDKAPLRRSMPTVHEKWNANIAILSGDAMLVNAMQALSEYNDPFYKSLAQTLQQTASLVCEGQQMDMDFESHENVSVEDYLTMIRLKTAVLLGCSLKMGAICAGAGIEDQQHLYDFGVHTGIAFQLLDDLLDAFAEDTKQFGKKNGGDIIAGKKTFLMLSAMTHENGRLKKPLLELLSSGMNEAEKVHKVKQIFRDCEADVRCRMEADAHTSKAIACISRLSASPESKKTLGDFALSLLRRVK